MKESSPPPQNPILQSIRLQIKLTELLLELHREEELRPLIKHIASPYNKSPLALVLFNIYYFTPYLVFPFSLSQLGFINSLQLTVIGNGIQPLTTNDELSTLMVIGARGVAKTALTTTALTYALCYNLQKYIVITSSSAQNSSEYLYEARSTLLTNKAIIRDFGRLATRERVDKETGIINRQRAVDFIANNKLKTRLESISTNESLRGRLYDKSRVTLLINDDIETVQTVRSQIVTEQIKQQIQEAENAMSHNPKIILLGNKLTNDGNVAYFEDKYTKMKTDMFKVITMKIQSWDTKFVETREEAYAINAASALNSNQSSNYSTNQSPYTLNIQSIQDIKERNDTMTFMAEYLCEPIMNILTLFKQEYFQHTPHRPHPSDVSHILIAIDGALSLKTTADYTAIVARYHIPTAYRTTVEIANNQPVSPTPVEVLLHARITPDTLFQAILSLNTQLRQEYPLAHIVWGIEEMMATQAFRPFFEAKHKHITLIPIKPKIKNKEDRIIKSLLYQYETSHIVHIQDSQEHYKQLEYELLRMPMGKHDDLCDAESMLWDPTLSNFIISANDEYAKFISPYNDPSGRETDEALLRSLVGRHYR